MAALAGRELSNCTFAAEPEASRGQNGQPMLQVTSIPVPPKKLALGWGAAATRFLGAQENRARKGEHDNDVQ